MENKWDIAATKAWNAIFSAVEAMRSETVGGKKMSLDAIAKRIGAGNRSTIKGWLSGERGGKDIAFPDMLRYLENLGFNIVDFIPMPKIRHMGENAPQVNAEGGEVLPVPVYAVAGAGPAVEIRESVPLFTISAPPSFANESNFALFIEGESMYPTIKNGSVVGVNQGARFIQNEVFAVRVPYEGLAVKRVTIAENQYILRSDNPDKNKYEDIRIFVEEAPNLIVGRVVWVWQAV